MTEDAAELLIVSVTPQNLERDDLWYAENRAAILAARQANPWWRDHTLVLERDREIKPSAVIRRLMDLGYERAGSVRGRGVFAVHGGIIEVWPVNAPHPWAIDFASNMIASLVPRKEARQRETAPSPRPSKKERGFEPGEYVVHRDHGIGIFRGIRLADGEKTGHAPQDREKNVVLNPDAFFVVEYAPPSPGREPDVLFVPTDQSERLAPYVGFTTPVIHRLGGQVWARTKRKIREDAEKFARELFATYRARHRAHRAPYSYDPAFLALLRDTFLHEETDDQRRAEREILDDLGRDRPMDRLLVGDVGFGKTEIAVRAAAAAAAAGRQVAVIAPTTILASQHERVFRERLGALAIRVASLSRLAPPDEERRVITQLAAGEVDCVVGTSRLLSSDVIFKNLGLAVIDEEQRFGVRQKERFKDIRAEVDVLSLSATPIPRTLSLALAKLRDISRLENPPPGRCAIATAVLPYGTRIIREAIAYELARRGQVYLLHNRVETIAHARRSIEKIIRSGDPRDRMGADASRRKRAPVIGVIHGRMDERSLIETMERFRAGAIGILIATTIIENGLDISSANTLIVDDAARLGLAQAHQLRGRIGRGDRQAFAYFLYKPQRLTERASKRLDALKEYAGLGAGYDIALRDMEIRGAGNVFGREQSGAINKVGLNLYCQMLAEATEEMGGT